MHVQNGFLTKWTLPPKWHIWTSAPSTSTSVAILFRGRVPPNLTINTCLVNVTLRSNVIGDANTDLSLLRECVIDVKVAAVTRLDFAAQLKELLNVINLVKVSRMRAQSLVYLYFKVSASTASFKSVSVACKSPQGHQTLSMNLNPSTGNYETSILPESNKLDFHFIVDGRWTTSPDYKVETDELGRDYNTLCFQKSDSRYLAHLDPEARVHLMREKKSLMMDLDALVNGLEVDCAATSSRLNSEEAAQWLAPIRSMKFAHAALKRARGDEGVAHEDDFAEDVAKVKEWVKLASQSVVHHELPVSTQSLQNGLKHLTDVAALDIRGMTLSEYLYSVGFVGLGIRVFRSQAAIANPWMLLVQYISTDYWDTASSMCMLHAGLKWHDSKGQVVEDVLIISDPISDPIYKLATSLSIHKTFNSIVFARNPDLYTPQQRVALLGLSFVTAVEQLYHPDTKALGKPKIRKMVEAVFNIAYTLRKLQSYNSTWTLLLKKLVQPNPALYLTEAEALPGVGTDTGGVQSVAQVLTAIGCIACFEVGSHSTSGFELFPPSVDKDVLARAALAILAESVSRGCRIMIKSDDGDESVLARSRRLLRKALCIGTDNFDATGMVPMPNVAGWILKGKKASGKFFRHPFWRSNASPQAVAACLAFSRTCATIWYREEARPSLEKVMSDPSKRAELFDTLVEAVIKDGGMHDFLVLYSHDIVDVSHDGLALASKDLLQVALYAQGVRYFDAKARRAAAEHLNLQDPYKLVQSIIQEERLSLQQDWILERHRELVKLTREVAQQKRRELRLVEQEAFLNTHLFAITRLFTPSDVAHLNQGRPANDQLEVLDTGLLKHHCCSPECPEFLVNQASDNDRLLNRRNGLYNHLKWYTLPDRRYANALHVTIKHLTLMHSKATHDASKVEELVLHDVCGHPKLKDFVMREGRAVLENWVHDAVRQYLKMK
ncbi:hypothetical protein BC830DRAFT_814282 [Chytriomyces sp. MP71]|nr:hypothetical protein BC830DRAFT_814282 [Chytriomyces sp. MP71]